MEQVALLSAGCQQWNLDVCACARKRFAYCASLAIYVFEFRESINTFEPVSILADYQNIINGISWCPNNSDLLGVASSDPQRQLCVWDVSQETQVAVLNTGENPVCLDWVQTDSDKLSYANSGGLIELWAYRSDTKSLLKDSSGMKSAVTLLRWHHSKPGRLVVGHKDGSLSLFQSPSKPQKHVIRADVRHRDTDSGDAITGMEWDRLSDDYLLVASTSSGVRLLDMTSLSVMMTFKLPSVASTVGCLAWLPEASGMFVTGDVSSGILRVWSVANSSPLETIRIKDGGFNILRVLPLSMSSSSAEPEPVGGVGHILPKVCVTCTFKDGGVGVYDLAKKKWNHLREQGHSETIFDCKFKPSSCNILATGSYDGTVKTWDVNTMKMISSSPGNEGPIYSVAWSPMEKLDCIAASTSANGVFIWDIAGDKISRRFKTHKGKVYRVCWNKVDQQLIASCGEDNLCIIQNLNGSVVKRFKHPARVFGCDWNPFKGNILATACEDGVIRVFNCHSSDDKAFNEFQGHTLKAFDVCWSPLQDRVLCSSSDDKTVRVWNYSSSSCVVLHGHTDNVRGLVWSPEIPHLLFSGSWDRSIRAWDTRSGSCIDAVRDHGADVYGLAIHPDRPFALASTSRDSTVRLWSLEPLFCQLQMNILTQQPWNKSVGDVDHCMLVGSPVRMCGVSGSGKLRLAVLQSGERPNVMMWKHVTEFFGYPGALTNLWELVVLLTNESSSPSNDYGSGVMLAKHLTEFMKSKAEEMESVKMTKFHGVGKMKKEDRLRKSAEIRLKLGQIQQYCELMVQVGDWEKAVVVAPAVSLQYWKSLMERWSDHLMAAGNDAAVPLCISTGNVAKLVDFLFSKQSLDDAMLVSQVAYEGGHSTFIDEMNDDGVECKTDNGADQRRHAVVCSLADRAFHCGDPVLAACYHLSVEDKEAAVWRLLRGYQLELAYCVGSALKVEDPTLLAAKLLARRCEKLGRRDLAVCFLKQLPDSDHQLQLLCARSSVALSELDALHKMAGIPGLAECGARASAAQSTSNKMEYCRWGLLQARPYDAFTTTLKLVKGMIEEDGWTLSDIEIWTDLLLNVKLHVVLHHATEQQRNELLGIAAYVGALKAIKRGYFPIVPALFNHAIDLLPHWGEGAVASELNAYHEHRRHQLDSSYRMSDKVLKTCVTLQKKLGTIAQPPRGGAIVVAHSALPGHSEVHTSYFTGQRIHGPVYHLDDGQSTLSLSEALMWAEVNPFSPLKSGVVINPF